MSQIDDVDNYYGADSRQQYYPQIYSGDQYQPPAIPGQYQPQFVSQSNSSMNSNNSADVSQQQQPSESMLMNQAKAKIQSALAQYGTQCQTAHFQLTPEETIVVSSAVDKFYQSNPLPAVIQNEINQQQQSIASNSNDRMGHPARGHVGGRGYVGHRYGSYYGGLSPYYWGPYGAGLTTAAILGATAFNPLVYSPPVQPYYGY
jgi:hypothetical protein